MNLGEIPKRNIYQVPEGYFEQLPAKIQNRIDASDENTILRSINEQNIWRFTAGIAASLLIFWLSWHYQILNFSDKDMLAGISETEMIAYLEQNIWLDEVQDDLLYEYFLQKNGPALSDVWQDLIELNDIDLEEDTIWQIETM
ncbi:MAG: hypothetical protein JJU28_19075 [Cyclobacteriaceae bacterium]|nr:hypothetical protein [Cyclobacteriaceae bacterium]